MGHRGPELMLKTDIVFLPSLFERQWYVNIVRDGHILFTSPSFASEEDASNFESEFRVHAKAFGIASPAGNYPIVVCVSGA